VTVLFANDWGNTVVLDRAVIDSQTDLTTRFALVNPDVAHTLFFMLSPTPSPAELATKPTD
jgi:hypothetical protein